MKTNQKARTKNGNILNAWCGVAADVQNVIIESFSESVAVLLERSPELKGIEHSFRLSPVVTGTFIVFPTDKPLVFASMDFVKKSPDERVFAVAHEIAHLKLNHGNANGGVQSPTKEFDADMLVLSWLRDYPRYQKYSSVK